MLLHDFKVQQHVINENNDKMIKKRLEDYIHQVHKYWWSRLIQKASQGIYNAHNEFRKLF